MRHVAAYLLLVLSGNAAPTADDVKGVLAAADIEADDAQLTRLITSLEGKNLDEILEAGQKKLTKMTASVGVAAAAPAGGAAAAADDKKASSSSSSAGGDGAANLFGGSDSDSDSSS